MSRSVLTLRSAVLIMHAVFYVPSVVAVPVLRPANASERAGHCIPGLQSHRNNLRNEVGVKSSTDVTSDRVAVGYELIADTCSLAMPAIHAAIVKASALACVAPFNLDGKRVNGKGLGATAASPPRYLAEYALSLGYHVCGSISSACGLFRRDLAPRLIWTRAIRWCRLCFFTKNIVAMPRRLLHRMGRSCALGNGEKLVGTIHRVCLAVL